LRAVQDRKHDDLVAVLVDFVNDDIGRSKKLARPLIATGMAMCAKPGVASRAMRS